MRVHPDKTKTHVEKHVSVLDGARGQDLWQMVMDEDAQNKARLGLGEVVFRFSRVVVTQAVAAEQGGERADGARAACGGGDILADAFDREAWVGQRIVRERGVDVRGGRGRSQAAGITLGGDELMIRIATATATVVVVVVVIAIAMVGVRRDGRSSEGHG